MRQSLFHFKEEVDDNKLNQINQKTALEIEVSNSEESVEPPESQKDDDNMKSPIT